MISNVPNHIDGKKAIKRVTNIKLVTKKALILSLIERERSLHLCSGSCQSDPGPISTIVDTRLHYITFLNRNVCF